MQLGATGCSDHAWVKARALVASGTLGTLLWAHASCRGTAASGTDALGVIRGVWPERLYPLMRALDVRDWPSRVSCIGGDSWHPASRSPVTGSVAVTPTMVAEFPSGVTLFVAGATGQQRDAEAVIRGRRSNVVVSGRRLALGPESADGGRTRR